jgi:hypothetical protein
MTLDRVEGSSQLAARALPRAAVMPAVVESTPERCRGVRPPLRSGRSPGAGPAPPWRRRAGSNPDTRPGRRRRPASYPSGERCGAASTVQWCSAGGWTGRAAGRTRSRRGRVPRSSARWRAEEWIRRARPTGDPPFRHRPDLRENNPSEAVGEREPLIAAAGLRHHQQLRIAAVVFPPWRPLARWPRLSS